MEPRRQAVVTTAAPENAHLSWRQEAGLRSAQHPKRGGACDNQCGSSNINITLSETSQVRDPSPPPSPLPPPPLSHHHHIYGAITVCQHRSVP